MREFSKISPRVWRSQRFRALASDDARHLHLYLLTCEHQNSAGAFRLPAGYACNDLNWGQDRFSRALAELEEAGLIACDHDMEELIVVGWFRHNPPMNLKHRKGIETYITRLESEDLQERVLQSLQEQSPSEIAEPRHTAANGSSGKELMETGYMRGEHG